MTIYHYQAPKPLIFLNFDINGTIVSLDTAEKTLPEGRICVELAKVLVKKWDERSEPMTFEKYVDTVLYPANAEAAKNTKERFMEWLEETAHPDREEIFQEYERIKELFTDSETGQINLDQIYPSFVYALEKLEEQGADYRICLRTFGFDLEKVVKQIQDSSWAKRLNIHFVHRGAFNGDQESNKNSFEFNKKRIEDIQEVFDTFVNSKEHFAIQDNYMRWKNNQEQARFGKPFLFPKDHFWKDREVICLMFDDYGHRIVSPVDVNTGEELKAQETPSLIVVNTFDAITKRDYFWKKILECIRQASPDYASQLEAGKESV